MPAESVRNVRRNHLAAQPRVSFVRNAIATGTPTRMPLGVATPFRGNARGLISITDFTCLSTFYSDAFSTQPAGIVNAAPPAIGAMRWPK